MRFALALIAASLLLFAVQAHAQRAPSPVNDEVVRARVETLLAQMTPEEKAGQLSLTLYNAQAPQQALRDADTAIAAGRVGGVFFVSDPATANRLQHAAIDNSRLHIPLLVGYDVLHGLRTIFPVPIGMAASFDPQIVEESQRVAAAEARAVGIHWTFAPNLDIARDARFGRIVEGPGEDPFLASAMARANVHGFQGSYIGAPDRLIAGPKHFVGYAAAMGGRDLDEVDLSDSELWNVYLPPFRAAVEAGAGNVMTAYMAVNGVPATGNRWLLTDVLRDTWGFQGFTVSDNSAVRALRTHGLTDNLESAAVRALHAGLDMEMIPGGFAGAYANIPAALASGRITQAEVDNAVRRVLEVKIRMGLFENPYVDEARAQRVLSDPDHQRIARIAAERSAVLLRNEGGVLPLNRRTLRSLAVIGPLADSERDMLGAWVFRANEPHGVTVLAGLRAELGDRVRIDYSEGVRIPQRSGSPFAMLDPPPRREPLDETAEIARAVELARNADVAVLVLGESQDMVGESASRASLELPGRQRELLEAVVATGKPVVLLVASGRPLNLGTVQPAAIMEIWYPGSQAGAAVANLLMGDAVPAGRLPFTWMTNAAQLPVTYARLNSSQPNTANNRYFDGSNAPAYPFGFGLSYTSFTYANLSVEGDAHVVGAPVTVSVDVTNSGTRRAEDVAQLYIHQRSGSAARPVRELKGFQRVALRAGETRRLTFVLRPDDLTYWSSATRSWVQEASMFDVWIGGASTAELTAQFEMVAVNH